MSMPEADKHEWQLDILEMSSADLAKFEIVDLREGNEDPGRVLNALLMRDITRLPLSQVDVDQPPFDRKKQYLLICQRGARSADLAASLRGRGWNNVYSLRDGVEAVRRKFIA